MMKNHKLRFPALFLAAAAAVLSVLMSSCGHRNSYISINGFAQGGTYTVKLNLEGENGRVRLEPGALKAGIDSVLQRVDNSVSGYNKGSVLSRFNAGESVVPDDIFTDIYDKSYGYYRLTDGAVDVAAAPLFDIWGFGFTSDSLPSADKVRAVQESCGMGRLRPEMPVGKDGTVKAEDLLATDDGGAAPTLNYNAVAQGYSCDLVASYLHSAGVKDMLVDIGGEIYCSGLNPGGRPWTVGVDRPVDGNQIPGADIQGIIETGPEPCGIVTSGNYRKYYIRDGKKYSHTIDPRTGYPVTHSLLSATVIAPDAALADALATYCMVVGLDKAREFIMSRPDVEGYLISSDGDSLSVWASPGVRVR